ATPRLFMGNFSQANIGGFLTALPGDLPFDPTLNSQFTGPINLFQGSLDFSGPWRNQQFRLGAAYFYTQDNRRVGSFQNGQFIFGPSLPQALNNLLLGQVSTFQVAVNPQGALPGQTVALPLAQPDFSRSLSSHDFSLYFSHNWRAHPRPQRAGAFQLHPRRGDRHLSPGAQRATAIGREPERGQSVQARLGQHRPT